MTSLQPPDLDSLASLPLICPRCQTEGVETRLVDGACRRCGFRLPPRDGIADFEQDEESERHRFYHTEDGYLSEPSASNDPEAYCRLTDPVPGLALEIGSGNGAYAGTGGSDYVALDYSLTHLRNHLRGFRRIRSSAERIPLESGSCRFLFTIATLEHVPDPAKAFAEIDRLLAPGGIACLAPAWHCRPWAAEGLPVRPYRDLTTVQKLRKATIPLRDSLLWRGALQIPWRIARRVRSTGRTLPLAWKPLNANYQTFWMSDSDACASIDAHEAILFFERRGYEILMPRGGFLRRLFFRAGPIVVRKSRERFED